MSTPSDKAVVADVSNDKAATTDVSKKDGLGVPNQVGMFLSGGLLMLAGWNTFLAVIMTIIATDREREEKRHRPWFWLGTVALSGAAFLAFILREVMLDKWESKTIGFLGIAGIVCFLLTIFILYKGHSSWGIDINIPGRFGHSVNIKADKE